MGQVIRKFSRDFLADMGGKTIDDQITGHGRWSVNHSRVFEWEGKLYETLYSVGATELQDEAPYQFDSEEVDCYEVVAKEQIAVTYVRLEESPQAPTDGRKADSGDGI